ncbi:hypothetical protein B0H63DRAFT_86274 [Podospora didyma]|uniref:Vegetative incompatibility protein HET-E-1 n=1 Tax=Podospora didyma TaxID=330526 RepID=A0AAE0K0F6_9PEZI|nr:hypothetical protein B0H63DRAFT_86274 [Podospora didyma]
MTLPQPCDKIVDMSAEKPESFDMYCQISNRLDSQDPLAVGLARRVLTWVADTSLSSEQLREAVCADGWDVDDDGSTEEFDRVVLDACCGLVEKDLSTGQFKFPNHTAMDFARSARLQSRETIPLIPEWHKGKAMIASRCIGYMTHSVPSQPLWGQASQSTNLATIDRRWPLLRFATLNWVAHCLDAMRFGHKESNDKIGDEVTEMVKLGRTFLADKLKLTVWVEALYTYLVKDTQQFLNNLQETITKTQSRSRRKDVANFLADLGELVRDLVNLHHIWGESMESNPAEIWGDMALFTNSQFLASTSSATVEYLAPRLEKCRDKSSKRVVPLFSISSSSSDARQLAVLSVFPADPFRKAWENTTDMPYHEHAYKWPSNSIRARRELTLPNTGPEIQDACAGWHATYKVFKVPKARPDRSESVSEVTIALEARDVEVCLRQSLRFSHINGVWELNFPLTISPQLEWFSVLGKIIHVTSSGHTYNVIAMPLQFHPRLQSSWSAETEFGAAYTYRTLWCPNSKYLALVDLNRASDQRTAVCIVIFGVAANKLNSHFPHLSWGAAVSDCHFHPRDPLLLYRADRDIFLWDFQRGDVGPRLFYSLPWNWVESTACRALFSSCGNFVELFHPGRIWPERMPLPNNAPMVSSGQTKRSRAYDEGGEDLDEFNKRPKHIIGTDDNQSPLELVIDTGKGSSPAVDSALSKLQDLPRIISTTSATNNLALSHISNHKAEIAIITNSNDITQPVRTISVARFPPLLPLHAASATVSLPFLSPHSAPAGEEQQAQGGEQLAKLILNATCPPLYRSDVPPAAFHLPLVVRKDVSALRVKDGPMPRVKSWGDFGQGLGSLEIGSPSV